MCQLWTDANVEFTVVIKHQNLWKFTEEACDMKTKLDSLHRLNHRSFEPAYIFKLDHSQKRKKKKMIQLLHKVIN